MANSSTFPNSLDSFTEKQEISASDRANISTYQYLLQQTTLTPSQQQQLTDLTNSLSDKLISASDFNHLQDAIYNTENFFLNQVESYFNEFTYVGSYSPATTYQQWNTVTYNGQSYLSLKSNNTGNQPDLPASSTYWSLIAAKGSTGATGPQGVPGIGLNFQGTYDSTKVYNVNDGVQYNGSLYACILQTTAGTSPTNGTYWTLAVAQGSTTQLIEYENKVVIASPQSNVQIGISQYNSSTDVLMVFINSTFAKNGTDYTIDANKISIDIVGATGATWNANTEFDFIVFKNSLTSSPVGVDGTQIQNGTVPNAALNADIKVGSLSALNTTTKTDVVSAINEVYTDAENSVQKTDPVYVNTIQSRVSPNLVVNSGFEDVRSTATLFSDALTSYTGSTVPAPWTLQSGSFTFGASGATSGATGSLMTAGNAVWKPVLGSDGTTKLAITLQATFVASGTDNIYLDLFQDSNNRYRLNNNSSTFYLYKEVSGTYTSLSSITQALTSGTTYTATLSLDNTGALTAKLYQGTNTSGTLLQTLTATDTSLTGGFLIGVGGDTGVVISNASVTGPIANEWTAFGTDSGCVPSYAITSDSASGKYGLSISSPTPTTSFARGPSNQIESSDGYSVSSSTSYTLSGYIDTSNLATGYGIIRIIEWTSTGGVANDTSPVIVNSKNGFTRYSATFTTQSTTARITIRVELNGSGTVTFDNIQLEQGSSATPYIPQTQHLQTPIDVPSITIKGSNIVTSVNGQTGAVTVQGYNPLTNPMAWIG